MKYKNLSLYLNSCGLDSVTFSFAELESVLGFSLPHSASTYSAWWANGGHSQAHAWMNAGYCVDYVSLKDRHVVFKKVSDVPADRTVIAESGRACKTEKTENTGKIEKTERQIRRVPADKTVNAEYGRAGRTEKTERNVPVAGGRIPAGEEMKVCGYTFRFLQEIIPECDENGKLIDYCPQGDYHGKDKKGLNKNGDGAFCHFSIHADDVAGVYLWVVEGEIIYIGETVKLWQRFNSGYGEIRPVNCYVGGQSTNCKMNKVVRTLFLEGKRVLLYFFQTNENKRVELELLRQIRTRYNVKDNH
jgi:hypothetical protein